MERTDPADQARAVQQIMRTQGMKVILERCQQVYETNCAPLPPSGDWVVERAIRDGKAAAAKEIMDWVASRALSRDSTSPTEA